MPCTIGNSDGYLVCTLHFGRPCLQKTYRTPSSMSHHLLSLPTGREATADNPEYDWTPDEARLLITVLCLLALATACLQRASQVKVCSRVITCCLVYLTEGLCSFFVQFLHARKQLHKLVINWPAVQHYCRLIVTPEILKQVGHLQIPQKPGSMDTTDYKSVGTQSSLQKLN